MELRGENYLGPNQRTQDKEEGRSTVAERAGGQLTVNLLARLKLTDSILSILYVWSSKPPLLDLRKNHGQY